ncbi:MAG TPA: hypothetical protein VD994_11115 [Prosthecobacter sp.]|nr:hypothetical protein [Prosthecobacter sp.]
MVHGPHERGWPTALTSALATVAAIIVIARLPFAAMRPLLALVVPMLLGLLLGLLSTGLLLRLMASATLPAAAAAATSTLFPVLAGLVLRILGRIRAGSCACACTCVCIH